MPKVVQITPQMLTKYLYLKYADIGKWAVQTKSSLMIQTSEQQARRLALYLTNKE